MKHTVVISDVHLCEAVPGDGLWMRYRQRRFFPDEELTTLLESLCIEARNDELTLVFNGDLFDFDAPPVIEGEVQFADPPRSEEVAVNMLGRILADHGQFVTAVARVLIAGHRVVFVSGNHDAQLAWPRVRSLVTERVGDAAVAIAGEGVRAGVESRVLHRAWFHAENGIHIEHGNQYDHFCSFRYATDPFTADGALVQPTMGSLSFRHLVSRMGYFNPHVDSSFMLSLQDYVAHWAKYYVRSKHSLAVAWARGAMRVMADIVQHKTMHHPERAVRDIERAAIETGTHRNLLAAHAELFAPPSAAFPALRELWLDRAAAIGAVGAAAVVGAAFAGPLAGAKLAVGTAGAMAAYELTVPKPTLNDTYENVARRARDIARIHSARAVIFGHTHIPLANWESGTFFGNSGTWSAAYLDIACTIPVDDGKPVIWLRDHDNRRLEGGLFRWRAGHLVPMADSAPELSVTPGYTIPQRA